MGILGSAYDIWALYFVRQKFFSSTLSITNIYRNIGWQLRIEYYSKMTHYVKL